MTPKKRDTVGKIASELLSKSSDTHSAHEQMQEQLNEYEKHMHNCIETHKKKLDGDFFIVVITKKERLMENVIRHYFFARHSCPTPDYDQSVYRYDKTNDQISFIWTIPSKHTCLFMRKYTASIPQEEWGLMKFVLDFADGTLFKKCKELNGEKDDTIELIK